MRKVVLFIGIALAWAGLAASPAAAHPIYHHHYHHYRHYHHHYHHWHYRHWHYRHHYRQPYYSTEPRYESCSCHFGYDGKGPGTCSPAVSCFSEGGRCTATCPSQTGQRGD